MLQIFAAVADDVYTYGVNRNWLYVHDIIRRCPDDAAIFRCQRFATRLIRRRLIRRRYPSDTPFRRCYTLRFAVRRRHAYDSQVDDSGWLMREAGAQRGCLIAQSERYRRCCQPVMVPLPQPCRRHAVLRYRGDTPLIRCYRR